MSLLFGLDLQTMLNAPEKPVGFVERQHFIGGRRSNRRRAPSALNVLDSCRNG